MVGLVAAGSVEAQAPVPEAITRATEACIAGLPASAFSPVTVDLVVDTPRTVEGRRVYPLALDLASRVATHLRTEFPSQSSVQPLAMAEPRLTWRAFDFTLRVRLHRDGRVTWTDSLGDSASIAGAKLLRDALLVVRDSGERIAWPPGLVRDSVDVTFYLQPATVDRGGKPLFPRERNPMPVFRVMHPWIEYAVRRGPGDPRYPVVAKAAGATAKLKFSFVVDTAGRVDPATARLTGHEDQPGQALLLLRHRHEFVESVRTFLERGRYAPMRIGGCAVRREVSQWFEFKIER